MNPVVWLNPSAILALHEEHLAEHGGPPGVRDHGLLDSALARPKDLLAYEASDIPRLAAAYGFGIVRNHPFIDGNKRTAFVATELFLNLNGLELTANDEACTLSILNLADGKLTEEAFADWLRSNTTPLL